MLGPMRTSTVFRLAAGALACAALAVPAGAGAAVIGPRDVAPESWDGSVAHNSFLPWTAVNLSVPDANVRSPISGTITRWRINVEATFQTGDGPMQLQVLRRTVNEPGNADDKFKVVRETSEVTSGFGKNVFQASLSIRKGDFIGVQVLDDDTAIREIDSGVLAWFDSFDPGDPAIVPDDFQSSAQHVLFNATVAN